MKAEPMPGLFIASTVLAFICLSTAAADWWTNGFGAEWAPTGLLLGPMFAFVAWITQP